MRGGTYIIYLAMEEEGTYDEYCRFPVKAFTYKNQAENFLKSRHPEWGSNWISDSIDEIEYEEASEE